jgi:predicted DNA-binding transcriptional regulator AlpA
MATEYLTAEDLEELTGTPASTFRYWASRDEGPASVKIGRRRVWKRQTVENWLARQEIEEEVRQQARHRVEAVK